MSPRTVACIVLALMIICLNCRSSLADPPKGNWHPIPELTDEFEGDKLDVAKWYDHNPQWKGRKPGYFSACNVSVSEGKLQLTTRVEDLEALPEGYHTFTTAAVMSRTPVRYGYFEIKCRPMNSEASSAFWFSATTKEEWTEIDVFEIGGGATGREHEYNMNAHVVYSPDYRGTAENHLMHPAQWHAPYRLADEYHVYALEWDATEIKWYVDGNAVRTLKNEHWHQPLNMIFDSETMPEWFGLPEKERLPSTFSIEYVRSWRRIEDAALPGPDGNQ